MTTTTIDEAVATADTQGTKPVKTFRFRALSVSVFENSTRQGVRTFFSATPQRTYKVGDEFRHSTSFTRDDLPVIEHLLKQAWEFILDQEAMQKDADDQ